MLNIDGQQFAQRATRGRKTKFVKRVLRAFGIDGDTVDSYAAIASWEYDEHLLFWDLLGYDGRDWAAMHGLSGMIGESKRLWAECIR